MDLSPAKLNRTGPTALYQQVAGLIADAISRGDAQPASRLPSEKETMDRLGVSRITVRQAIALLEKRGLIEVRQGKGSFVANVVVQHELEALRGFYDALVTQGLDPRTRLLSFKAMQAPSSIRGLFEERAGKTMRLERVYLVDDKPFALARAWLLPQASKVSRAQAVTHPIYSILQKLLDLQVDRADVGIVARACDADEARLLELSDGSPVLVMDRVSRDARSQVLEATSFTIRPENYRFSLSVRGPIAITRKIRSV